MAINPLQGVKALIVDDQADICDILGFVLDMNGIQVTGVTSVREALEVYSLIKPNIVIADITMPFEDGFSLIRKIRSLSLEEGGQVPAIALTGHSSREIRLDVLAAGFQELLTKPVDVDQLLKVTKTLLDSSPGYVTK